ncbi:MAG: HAMP domain-containing protein [Deltaproteobacteria bacterium]|nr:HAMP domain-containing protein [Deltaproteobacteria bacterium]
MNNTILIIEDDTNTTALITLYCEREGFRTLTASAGNFALRVPAITEDEVGQLARAFNRMSESLEKIENLRRNLMIDVAHDNLKLKDLPHIFERFYRGEKSRFRQHGGAGIGLAIVKELIEAHKGTVDAELQEGHIHICVELPK